MKPYTLHPIRLKARSGLSLVVPYLEALSLDCDTNLHKRALYHNRAYTTYILPQPLTAFVGYHCSVIAPRNNSLHPPSYGYSPDSLAGLTFVIVEAAKGGAYRNRVTAISEIHG